MVGQKYTRQQRMSFVVTCTRPPEERVNVTLRFQVCLNRNSVYEE